MTQRWKTAARFGAVMAVSLALGLGVGTLGARAWLDWRTPKYETGDHRALYERAGRDIVLFSTSTCRYCRDLRAWLDARAIVYRDYVVDRDRAAQALFDSLGGGPVPLLYVGDRRIAGFRPDVVEAALAAASAR